MIITNFKELARNPLREKALLIAEAGYEAIDIEKSIKERISLKDGLLKIKGRTPLELSNFQRIFIIGIGKGSALASAALAEILGNRLTAGITLDIQKPNLKSSLPAEASAQAGILNLKSFVGTHPLPSIRNVKATQEIIKLAKRMTEKDLLIAFICGGGSALACASETELESVVMITKALTKAGANIIELNTVRKHLSEFKGGGLAKTACPATVISLIVSDVCGNDLSMVSSGPTVLDKTTKADAEDILRKYGLNPADFPLIETPKDEKYFATTTNILFVCNQDAITAMLEKARLLGFTSRIYSSALEGGAKDIFLPIIKEIKSNEAILAGGETTVTFKTKNSGKGGRNQEAVLGALNSYFLNLKSDVVFMSLASDGRDNTEAAGAIGDAETLKTAQKLNLDPQDFLANHNSFGFFEKIGDLIFTEQKGFNVADLMIILKE